ncbi:MULTISPECIES: GNAT family N-acetyltransferase [unclassified Paenibacillus]|uniref:GNAT family N-acetyltransferase n=1 Tax=Paenibacillus TaxID=44249 RepID=UPI002784F8CA|nr:MULTISPECIES: GNAT family N-acetyltransferase [unclassified Paenibacillus]MDQ0719137.1 acetoin utilization protein AcuA [Paenibacillus sp. W4I10]MDR6717983.1 acetoin utilization protein AcuA [Paenibacillus sp. 2003]
MEHIKEHHIRSIFKSGHRITVEGPVQAEEITRLAFHPDLDAFRRPTEQQEALAEIAALPEGRIIIAHENETIIGYVTFHYADDCERWSEGNMTDLIELGAIEVADDYRSLGIGREMLLTALEDKHMENYIIFTTEYYWHWDLKGSGLNVWDYRKMMERLMETIDMTWYATDDPEICSHPANCLMVRIGSQVPITSEEQFDRVRFRHRFMY